MNQIKILGIVAASLIIQSCAAQNKITAPEISQAEVSRIIKTLSADEMMGRSALRPKEIRKSADFIASEFKRSGLLFFGGANSYLQNFKVGNIKPIGGTLKINGQNIDIANFTITSSEENINLSSLPKVIKIVAGDNFTNKFREVMGGQENALIQIDSSFKSMFARYKGFLERGNMSFKDEKSPNLIFVIFGDDIKSIDLKYKNEVSETPMFNVVGVLPGKSKPNEYVVFSGHYDHLGVIKAVNQDSIANGADDDASGTTAVIELAKYFSQKKDNERTIIFVAFTAEEIGGYGSQYFSKQLNPDEVVAMFNIEMIGKESKFGKNNAFITGYERSDFGKILQKNLLGTEFKFYPDPYPAQNLFYRSDNATLARLGVPAHTISSDQIDTDKLYHSVDDEFETMDIGNITEIIKAIAISSTSIVEGKDTPSRVSGVK
jgi:hypothetical protein